MDDQINLNSLSYSDLPLVIDMNLYKNNYYDNIIIGQLKKNSRFIKFPGSDAFIVSASEFRNIGDSLALKNEHPYYLREMWVNYQKQHEFNPLHYHSGIYSFVVWMKIPTDW